MKGNFETIASPEQPSGAISPVREKYVINNVYSNNDSKKKGKNNAAEYWAHLALPEPQL